MKEIGNYKDDKLVGDVSVMSTTGEKIADLHYTQDGKKTGKWTYLYPNGRVQQEFVYENDKPIGTYKKYYENGVISEEGQYKDGLLD